MNLNKSRLGILFTPTTPLWSGTVVSYSTAGDVFTLTVATLTGSLASIDVGMAVEAGGELARIKAINVPGGIFTLAENPVSSSVGGGFAAGASVAVYNIYYPMPKYENDQANYVVEHGDVLNQLSNWSIVGATGQTLYWEIEAASSKVMLYTDWNDNESKVARGAIVGTTVNFEERNASGVSGTCTIVAGYVNAGGSAAEYIEILAGRICKDYNTAWASLGASDNARSKAAQGPVAIVDKSALNLALNEVATVDAADSFATYVGSNVPGTIRYPATIALAGHVWSVGGNLTIVSGQNTPIVTVRGSSVGFGYLIQTVTDSNGATQRRIIPVWVGIAPSRITGFGEPWQIGAGWSADIEAKVPPTILRHSLACVIDLDTNLPYIMGFIWPVTYNYDFESSTLTFTLLTTFAFMRLVGSYPVNLTGVKGDPVDWDNFDMLSVPRSIYFILRWHSNLLELMNVEFDVRTASIPTGYAAENRLVYTTEFTAGNLQDQFLAVCRSSFYDAYGDLMGNVEVIPSLLYGDTILGAIYDTLTLDLTTAEVYDLITRQLPTHQMLETRLSGVYHDSALNFHNITVRAPTHPGQWGTPDEVEGLVSTPEGLGGVDWSEIIRWAGRHMGVANYSETYTFKCLIEIDPAIYKMVDIPSVGRLVIQEIRNEHNPEGLLINQVAVGKTFGSTLDAVVEPPVTIAPEDPPVIPIPVPPPPPILAGFVMTTRHLGRAFNFFDTTPTEWQDIGPRVGNEATIGYYRCMAVDKVTGEAWALTKADVGTDATNGLFYTASTAVASPVWTLIYSQAQYKADVLAAHSLVAGSLNTLALAVDGTVYAQADDQPAGYGGYVWGNSGGIAYVWAGGYAHDYNNVGATFGTWAGATEARFTFGQNTNPGSRIIEMVGGTHSSVFQNYNCWELSSIHKNNFILKMTGGVYDYDLCSFVDQAGEAPPGAEPVNYNFVWQDAWNARPLVLTDGHYFWTRITDGALMIDNAVQALVNTAGAVTGVFSSAGANGGGYCNVVTYGHIIWAAASADALNTIRNIGYTGDGVTWVTKDGDWATAMGEAYEGDDGSACPMVGYTQVPE